MGNCLKKHTARACRLALHKQLRLSPAAEGQGVKPAALEGTFTESNHSFSSHLKLILWFILF